MKTIPTQLVLMETNEDVEMSLQCAEKIKMHIIRLMKKEGKSKYSRHLKALEAQITPLNGKA